MGMRSVLAACSQILLSGLSRTCRLFIASVLWLLPAIALSQVLSPGDDDLASLPDRANQHVLQLGAFADPANAARMVEDLQQKGFPAVTRSSISDAGDTLTYVLAGPYANQDVANVAKADLETHGLSGFLRSVPVVARRPVSEQVPVQHLPGAERAPTGVRVGGTQVNLAQDQAQLFAQAQRELFEVPPVIERPLGMEEGPRVIVSQFSLSGAVDREKQDLWVSDVEGILAGHVRLQPPDGYTINQLQAVADEITRYYRERGFIIAQAIIPAQEVSNGAVSLQVLEGSLEDVRVEDNKAYKAKVIEGPFRRLRGHPITQAGIERALLDVQDFPGLTVFGTFTQGDELGNTDLVVRVREEDQFSLTPTVDNYGSDFTGEYRLMLDFQFNDLFGVADQVNGYILQTFEPDNGTYGGMDFRFPFGRNAIGFGASKNQFDVGVDEFFALLGVEGTVDQTNLYWDHRFANGRFFSASSRLGLATKSATTELAGIVESEDNLAVASLGFDFFKASRKGRGFSVGSVQLDVGLPGTLGAMEKDGDGISSRQGGDGLLAGGDFSKLKFNFQYLRRLSANNSLLLRADGQWTDDILVALEQYAIGGPQNVRAYPVAEALVDTGTSATLEWIINAPGFADKPMGSRTWGEIFQLSFYADYAFGETNNPLLSQEPTVDYSGYGMGLQFNVPGKFFARADVASPIGSREPTNDRDPQYYIRMSYSF